MTAADLDRLRKVCSLLGSPVEGEAHAALHKANKLLRKAKLTRGEVIAFAPGGPHHREPPPSRPPPRADLGEIPTADISNGRLRCYGEVLVDEHERGQLDLGDVLFLRSVLGRRRWTPRQRGASFAACAA